MKAPIGFIYLWYDKQRKMFYIGSHKGKLTDSYTSSSRWLNGEIRYRPQDFKRRILEYVYACSELRVKEYKLIKRINDCEFGTKYYNLKSGRPKGCIGHNKGKVMSEKSRKKISIAHKGRTAPNKGVAMSEEQKTKISKSTQGRKTHNKGKPNPNGSVNGKIGAITLAKKAKGRKRYYLSDSEWTWIYKDDNGSWYWRRKINNKKWEPVQVPAPI